MTRKGGNRTGWVPAAATALLVAAAGGEVIEEIRAEIAANPNDVDLYVELAMEYEDVKNWRDAAAAYGRAIGLAPGDAYLHFRLGEVYLAADRLGEAIDSYREALSLDGDLRQARYQTGRCYLGLRQYEEARDTFEDYVASSPYDFNGRWYLGRSLEKTGRPEEALAQYKKILDYSTGAFASVGKIGVFGTSDDLAAYVRKLETEIYGE